ncbi:hypothetical protein [Lacipirellula sp.]|uniref:hypothetical protein n=1 Tax=Lacipirellula sp. TaxID=2691419 RepID=UPI003D11DD20
MTGRLPSLISTQSPVAGSTAPADPHEPKHAGQLSVDESLHQQQVVFATFVAATLTAESIAHRTGPRKSTISDNDLRSYVMAHGQQKKSIGRAK